MTPYLISAVCLLIAILIGYATGRRVGFRAGKEEGRLLSRLELREQSLRKGVCPTCDKSVGTIQH
ncbi:hypothetical protein [Tumebacillus lipolyticus]|uniref:Uncharacterized protein n=1 Tax=Tumebacillus lipolyticus TaxID=1280370 RepID=A0ABW4ZRF0_9BACL